MRLRPINMAIQPAARRPHVFMELLFCSLRNTSCRTRWHSVRTQTPSSSVGPGSGLGVRLAISIWSTGRQTDLSPVS